MSLTDLRHNEANETTVNQIARISEVIDAWAVSVSIITCKYNFRNGTIPSGPQCDQSTLQGHFARSLNQIQQLY